MIQCISSEHTTLTRPLTAKKRLARGSILHNATPLACQKEILVGEYFLWENNAACLGRPLRNCSWGTLVCSKTTEELWSGNFTALLETTEGENPAKPEAVAGRVRRAGRLNWAFLTNKAE